MERKITVEYYSDVLCVWAWIAQRRIDELNVHFGERIHWRYRYMDIFGDAKGKIVRQWFDRELFEGFGRHVVEAASAYETAPVNQDVWTKVQPTTSANAHLFLKAVEITCSERASVSLALAVRSAFFVEALDISDQSKLLDVAAQVNCDVDAIASCIKSGEAIAALMRDYQLAREWSLKGSPSYVLDGGRQILYGNVGYRVLAANVEELLRQPAGEASWC